MPSSTDKTANESSSSENGPASETGKSPHAFMVEAFGVKTRLLDHRRAFLAAALRAERAAFDDGQGYAAADVDAYFEALAAEKATAHPRLQTWRR